MIEIKELSKKYASSSFYALSKASLKITPGKIVGFIGPNGAGKSTTIKMITGALVPTSGDVFLNGHSITKNPIEAKKQFAYVPDSPDLFLKLTGREYLNFMGNIFNIEQTILNKRIDELSEKYLMYQNLDNLIDSYSHGMRQKIIVMGALVHEPDIWILDEPLTGLDPQASRILKNSMREHANKGYTVLFSTHVLEVAEKLCDEIIIINKSEIVYQGSLEALKNQYPDTEDLEDIFLAVTSDD